MKRVKTAELTGAALDFAVSKADNPPGQDGWGWWERDEQGFLFDPLNECRYSPSTDWAQGGPIIEREMIDLRKVYSSGRPSTNPYDCWKAEIVFRDEKLVAGDFFAHGPTPLIAAMRCFVTKALGDEVDVPEELLS